MRLFRQIIKILASLLLLLLVALLGITYTRPSKQLKPEAIAADEIDKEAVFRLSEAIKIRTITPLNPKDRDTAAHISLISLLEESYPLVHSNLIKERVEELSLLYTWQGRDTTLEPYLLMAHMDVVPADDSTDWSFSPFSGAVADGYIYGRGTLDIKSGVLGIMEAIEALLKKGYQPAQTIYLAFGHDEESGTGNGAESIAKLLRSRNIRLSFVLDEGGLILNDALPGLEKPVALIGIAEKGFMNVEIVARGEGGHTSMPPNETAVTRLADAIRNIKEQPFPSLLSGAAGTLFDHLGPEMRFPNNVLFTNRWLFDPLIRSQMGKRATTNASIRTTTAVTVLKGSSKENVLPPQARAIANLRLLPGTSPEAAIEFLRRVVNDTMVEIRPYGQPSPPSMISDIDAPPFRALQQTVHNSFPDVLVAPFQLIALTDSRHFSIVSDNIYRFHPARYEQEDLKRIHGKDEKIAVENYKEIIQFYMNLIRENDKMNR